MVRAQHRAEGESAGGGERGQAAAPARRPVVQRLVWARTPQTPLPKSWKDANRERLQRIGE